MSDALLRRLERSIEGGGIEVHAQLIAARVRAGAIPHDHVIYASHLGDARARLLEPTPRLMAECPNCRWRREERIRRNRDPNPAPTPLRETPRQCFRCNGAETVLLHKGLIPFVQEIPVDHRLLVAWTVDCAEHQQEQLSPRNPEAFQGRYRLPNRPLRDPELAEQIIPACRHWLRTGEVSPLLYQRASINSSINADLGTIGGLATAVAASGMEGQERNVRVRLAGVVSGAYHAAGGTKAERSWQEQRLSDYLLGYIT